MLAITNGKLLTITQGVIEGGTLLADQGKITAIGKDMPYLFVKSSVALNLS